MDVADTGKRVLNLLLSCPPSPDAYSAPILAVDVAMSWETGHTIKFVEDLEKRKLTNIERRRLERGGQAH